MLDSEKIEKRARAAEARKRFIEKNPNYFKERATRVKAEALPKTNTCRTCGKDISSQGVKGSCQYCTDCQQERRRQEQIERTAKNPNCFGCGVDITRVPHATKWCGDCRAQARRERKAARRPSITRYPCEADCGVSVTQPGLCATCTEKKLRADINAVYALRTCRTCGTNIGHRGKKAFLCEEHSLENRKALTKKWALDNPDKERARTKTVRHNRRAWEKTGRVSSTQWQSLLTLSNHTCHYCGQPGYTMDHMTPLSKGGQHSIENIVVACMSCNTRKGVTGYQEFKDYICPPST